MSLIKRIINLEQKVTHLERLYAPRQEDKTGDSPENAASKQGDSTPRQPATVKQAPATKDNANKPQHSWYKTIEGWYYFVAITGIPFAIGYAVVTYFQWHDLRAHFKIEQRAWIRIKHMHLPEIKENSVISAWPVAIDNIGKSPAVRTRVYASFEIVDRCSSPSFNVRKPNVIEFATIFPGDEGIGPLMIGLVPDSGEQKMLSKDQLKDLSDGKKYLTVFGEVLYADQFGPHWTRFCVWQAFAQGPASFYSRPGIDWSGVGDRDHPPEK